MSGAVEGVDFIESSTRRVAFRTRTVLNSQQLSDFYAGRPVEGAEDVAKTTANPGAILEADQTPLSHVPQSRGVRSLRAAYDRKAHDRLQAYVDWAEADDGRDCPGIVPDDVARLLASRTTPPARSHADDDQVYAKGRQDGYAAGRSHALDDAAKVADDLCADMTVEADAEPGVITKLLHRASAQAAGKLAAAIRLLSQGGKA